MRNPYDLPLQVDVIAAVHEAMLIPIFGLRFITIQADPDQSLKNVQGRIVELEPPALPEPKDASR